MIAPIRRFGPWSDMIDDAERRAQLRALQAITRLCCGPRGATLANLLRQAEHDLAALDAAHAELDRLAALDKRHVLATFAALARPAV